VSAAGAAQVDALVQEAQRGMLLRKSAPLVPGALGA
jgi:hypothetical protein